MKDLKLEQGVDFGIDTLRNLRKDLNLTAEVVDKDSLDDARMGLGMLQGDVKPMPMMRFADGGFGGITEAVESIEEKPKEFLVDKLKVTQKPGQSEMRAIIEAMYNDIDGVMPEDRKREFYELYAPQMYMSGEMEKPEFEFIQTEILDKEVPKMKEGGIMDLGGKEMDLRKGGFVPIGKKESGG